jgi:hypothetical protein
MIKGLKKIEIRDKKASNSTFVYTRPKKGATRAQNG